MRNLEFANAKTVSGIINNTINKIIKWKNRLGDVLNGVVSRTTVEQAASLLLEEIRHGQYRSVITECMGDGMAEEGERKLRQCEGRGAESENWEWMTRRPGFAVLRPGTRRKSIFTAPSALM